MKVPSFTCLLLPLLLADIPAAGQSIEQREADSLLAIWNDASRVDTVRFDAFNQLLKRTYHTITRDSIVRVGEQLVAFASRQGLKSRMSTAKTATGNGYYLQGDLVRAKAYYAAALALNDRNSSALNGLSAVCMGNGVMAQAIEHQSQALVIAETLHDTASIITLLNNIGSNHGLLGDNATALIYMERELALAVKTGDTLSIADALMNIGASHAQLGDEAKTIDAYERSLHKGKARKVASGLPYFEIRIGIHTGPVVAGIVGVKKFAYDIWGYTVNTASRLESSGEVGEVNISASTYGLVKDGPDLLFAPRGKVEAKGKGELEMFVVRRG